MKKRLTSLCALALIAGCDTPSPNPGPQPQPTEATPSAQASTASDNPMADGDVEKAPPIAQAGPADAAVNASNGFGLALYQRLDKSAGNVAFSPASVSLALAMTYAGAQGDTAAEMRTTLQLPNDPKAVHGGWATVLHGWQGETEAEISVANRLFGDKRYTFEAPFLTVNQSRYGAPLQPADFAGNHEAERLRINTWVGKQTKNRILNLLPKPGITRDTRLVLVNALYFKATWAHPFKEHATEDGDFTTEAGTKVTTAMMHQTAHMQYAEVDGVQVAQLGYKGGRFATAFVLPKAGDDLASLEKRLDRASLDKWVEKLSGTRVEMQLPKFEIEPGDAAELSAPLKAMGMRLAFDQGKADFTGITKPKSPADELFIEKVFHKTFVGMDEKGTEAAAATAVVMGRKGAARPSEAKKFVADRPFLFFVRDTTTGLVMFAGRVADPTK